MAEQADALDLESSGATRAGSIPVIRTKSSENAPLIWTKNWYNYKGDFLWN